MVMAAVSASSLRSKVTKAYPLPVLYTSVTIPNFSNSSLISALARFWSTPYTNSLQPSAILLVDQTVGQVDDGDSGRSI